MDEKIKDRIAKLIAKAEGTDNEEERDTFMAAAVKMMTRHQLDEADVRAGMGKDYLPPEILVEVWNCPNGDGLAQARTVSANLVAFACGCHAVIMSSRDYPSAPWTLKMYGTREALDTALVLIRSLSVQWEAAASKAWDAHVAAEAERMRQEQEAYYSGPIRWGEQRSPSPPRWNIPRPEDLYMPYGTSGSGWGYARNTIRLTPAQEEAERLIKQFKLPPGEADSVRRNLGIPTEAERYALEQEQRMRYGYRATRPEFTPERRTAFFASFIHGFGSRVAKRLSGTREAEVAEHPGAGLVLAADSDRARAKLNEDYPSLGSVRAEAMDYDALAAGDQAGAGADLGGQRFGWAAERGPRGIGA